MYDPSDFTVVITDSSGATVQSDTTLDKMAVGTFIYLWNIPSTTASGKYTMTLSYTVETVDGARQ